MYMCLLTFFVMISCMCLTGGVNWVGAGFGIHICVVGCWGFPIYLSCWFGVVLGRII